MFVVPVYGQPPWLDRCIESLQRQTVPSRILITTATPSEFLTGIARRRGVEVEVNPVSRGIGADWNFALSRATRRWVTLAHQDDWYDLTYAERCLQAAATAGDATIVFTASAETRDDTGEPVPNARIKHLIRTAAFLGAPAVRSRFRKRLLLAFGNPIPASAVMINRAAAPDLTFSEQMKSNLDWVAWLELARRPGAFAYVRETLVHRTIHREAATVVALEERGIEDEFVLRRLWPRPVAGMIVRLYALSLRQYGPPD
jgi:glycosyltransferase involved in cell wall biosynthesis